MNLPSSLSGAGCVVSTLVLALSSPLAAQQSGYTSELTVTQSFGRVGGDFVGEVVGSGGDVNGDGVNDYIVAAPSFSGSTNDTGSTVVYSGATHSVLWGLDGAFTGDAAMEEVLIVPDLNGDGNDDVLLANIRADVNGVRTVGYVDVRSGLNAQLIARIEGVTENGQFGTQLASIGDVNQDGIADIAISAPGDFQFGFGAVEGEVRVVSGADFSELYTILGTSTFSPLGQSIAAVGDWDGDGAGDFAVAGDFSEVTVYSGATGTDIYRDFRGLNDSVHLSVVDDANGDGLKELAVGRPQEGSNGETLGEVEVFAWENAPFQRLRPLWRTRAQTSAPSARELGSSLALLSDLNRDGVREILAGAQGALSNQGMLVLLDGASGAVLKEFTDASIIGGPFVGREMASIGELGGQGSQSVIVGLLTANNSVGEARVVEIQGILQVDSQEISAANGGAFSYHVDFPSDAAGDIYQLLASQAGTGPTPLPGSRGIFLPLTIDLLLADTYVGQYPGIVQNGQGVLDAQGSATIDWLAPAGAIPAALVGNQYYLAVACRSAVDDWRHVSENVTLTILP